LLINFGPIATSQLSHFEYTLYTQLFFNQYCALKIINKMYFILQFGKLFYILLSLIKKYKMNFWENIWQCFTICYTTVFTHFMKMIVKENSKNVHTFEHSDSFSLLAHYLNYFCLINIFRID
jgi:hypothetical protein